MNKKIILLALLLFAGIMLINGCGSSGYDYNQRQSAPVGGGCGVQAPLDGINCEISSDDASLSNVNVDESAF